MIDDSAAQAAIRAGYSQKCARQQGQRLLTNADILRASRMMLEDKVAAAIQQRLRAGRKYRNIQDLAEIQTGLAEPENLFRAQRKVEPVDLQRAIYGQKTPRLMDGGNLTKPDIGRSTHAHEILRNPEVQIAIQKAMAERSARTEITADEVAIRCLTFSVAQRGLEALRNQLEPLTLHFG